MKIIRLVALFFLIVISVFVLPGVRAEGQLTEETLEAKVTRVIEEKYNIPENAAVELYQKLELLVTRGLLKDRTITVENGNIPVASQERFKVGDQVVVSYVKGSAGEDRFYITGYVRRSSLIWLSAIFILVVVIVGRWYGVTSLAGMVISFFIIFRYILPEILSGRDPVQVAITGSVAIVPFTFYLSHGFNKKTTVAIIGTIISLVGTGLLAKLFVDLTRLTGFASEEATFIQSLHGSAINIKGLLLAGIIISGIGVFDDVTVSQASIVNELKNASPGLSFRSLYGRAMKVGHDHIASVVNTLVLVYTGSALPLLILFIGNPRPFAEIVNYELIAEEIVKTLVASIGLVLSVPVTTLFAALVFSGRFRRFSLPEVTPKISK